MKNKLLLLCAPSGSGKSTAARALRALDDRFKHVQVLTTRELREEENGSSEKVRVTFEELQALDLAGKLVNFNKKYDTWYGIKYDTISDLLANGFFPVLEFPIELLSSMRQHYATTVVLMLTVDPTILFERLKDGRDPDGIRMKALEQELVYIKLHSHEVDFIVRNHIGNIDQIVNLIYAFYLSHIN